MPDHVYYSPTHPPFAAETEEKSGKTLMAANAPMMIQEAMVKGHPQQGILPSGQIAGTIGDLPAVEELIQQIVAEAEAVLDRFAAASTAANSAELVAHN